MFLPGTAGLILKWIVSPPFYKTVLCFGTYLRSLASGRDPVLAAAAQSLNSRLSPEEAGTLFPYQWPKE
jgi:hypothetical protein